MEDQGCALHTLSIAPWLLRGGQWGGWEGNMCSHFRAVASGGRCGLLAPIQMSVSYGDLRSVSGNLAVFLNCALCPILPNS